METWAIGVHAVAAALALVAAALALATGRLRGLHAGMVALMTLALVPALILGWNTTPTVLRGVFVGLLLLGLAMTALAWQARTIPLASGRVTASHVDRLGFNTISLVVGFGVVAALRASIPAWLVVIGTGAVIAIGHVGIRIGRRRLPAAARP